MLKLIRLIYFPLSIAITSLVCIPICLVRPRSVKNTELFLNIYARLTFPFMGFSYEIHGREILDQTKPAVIVGNHQHNFDIMLAGKLFNYKTVSLGKRQLAFLPLFGQVFWLAGNVLITRGSKNSAMKTMREVEEYLRSKKLGMVIFPEGHRNPTEQLLPFKKGAFYTAINCQIPLVIFVVSQYAKNMQLNKWQAGKMVVKILPPISTIGMTEKDIPRLMQEVREKMRQGIEEVNQLALA